MANRIGPKSENYPTPFLEEIQSVIPAEIPSRMRTGILPEFQNVLSHFNYLSNSKLCLTQLFTRNLGAGSAYGAYRTKRVPPFSGPPVERGRTALNARSALPILPCSGMCETGAAVRLPATDVRRQAKVTYLQRKLTGALL